MLVVIVLIGATAGRLARLPGSGLLGPMAVTIVLLLGLIVATLATFAPIHLGAAGLMVPYLAWVAFASALTYSVWRGNPGQLGA